MSSRFHHRNTYNIFFIGYVCLNNIGILLPPRREFNSNCDVHNVADVCMDAKIFIPPYWYRYIYYGHSNNNNSNNNKSKSNIDWCFQMLFALKKRVIYYTFSIYFFYLLPVSKKKICEIWCFPKDESINKYMFELSGDVQWCSVNIMYGFLNATVKTFPYLFTYILLFFLLSFLQI